MLRRCFPRAHSKGPTARCAAGSSQEARPATLLGRGGQGVLRTPAPRHKSAWAAVVHGGAARASQKKKKGQLYDYNTPVSIKGSDPGSNTLLGVVNNLAGNRDKTWNRNPPRNPPGDLSPWVEFRFRVAYSAETGMPDIARVRPCLEICLYDIDLVSPAVSVS